MKNEKLWLEKHRVLWVALRKNQRPIQSSTKDLEGPELARFVVLGKYDVMLKYIFRAQTVLLLGVNVYFPKQESAVLAQTTKDAVYRHGRPWKNLK